MINELQQIGVIATAGAFGAIIGLEREYSRKPAGLRTHMLVAAASAMLVVLGNIVLDEFKSEHDASATLSADPIRVIQAIVVGISFLGAGTIIRGKRNQIEGLTTAASVLLTSAIGIAVAIGSLMLAAGITALTVIVLVCVGWIEDIMNRNRNQRDAGN